MNSATLSFPSSSLLQAIEQRDDLNIPFLHGFLTALSAGPTTKQEVWMAELGFDFNATPPAIIREIQDWQKHLASCCYHDAPLDIPCQFSLGDEDLSDWCEGFMEVVFLQEEQWFKDESLMAELTLPMVLGADLDDDPQIRSLRKNRKIAEPMLADIPELVKEIYLHFHPA